MTPIAKCQFIFQQRDQYIFEVHSNIKYLYKIWNKIRPFNPIKLHILIVIFMIDLI